MKQLPIWCASAPYDSFGTLQKTTCRTSLCNLMTLHLRSSIVFLTAWLVLKPMIQTNSNMHAFLPTTTPSKIIHTPCFADVSRLKQFFVGTFLRTLPQLNVCERCLAGHRGDHKHYIRLDGVHVKSILSNKGIPTVHWPWQWKGSNPNFRTYRECSPSFENILFLAYPASPTLKLNPAIFQKTSCCCDIHVNIFERQHKCVGVVGSIYTSVMLLFGYTSTAAFFLCWVLFTHSLYAHVYLYVVSAEYYFLTSYIVSAYIFAHGFVIYLGLQKIKKIWSTLSVLLFWTLIQKIDVLVDISKNRSWVLCPPLQRWIFCHSPTPWIDYRFQSWKKPGFKWTLTK